VSNIDRRTFVAAAASTAATLLTDPRRLAFSPDVRATAAVRVGVVGLPGTPTDPRSMGLTLGAEESTHAAGLFGGSFQLVAWTGRESRAQAAGLSAIVGGDDCAAYATLARTAGDAGVPFMNVFCSADALRGAACQRTMFHVAPSDAMLRDAQRAAHVTTTAMAWHPSLMRFGADTLNHRFVARFGQKMTSDAWAAWMAVKIIWESSLRANSGEPAKILDFLLRDSTQFDGHKGAPLSFRSWDHQLRQPLYVEGASGIVDVPALKPDEPVRAALDHLGTGEGESACHATSHGE
jgi:hypothetical protein